MLIKIVSKYGYFGGIYPGLLHLKVRKDAAEGDVTTKSFAFGRLCDAKLKQSR